MPKPDPRHALKRALGSETPSDGRPVVVLGVGSELRADDAAGLRVAAALGRDPIPGVHALEAGPAPENCTAEIRRLHPSHLIIVDCAQMGEPPGTIRLVPPEDIAGVSFGTHGLPLSVLAEYIRVEVGCRVLILGIQPRSIEVGETLSPEVASAVSGAVLILRDCLASNS